MKALSAKEKYDNYSLLHVSQCVWSPEADHVARCIHPLVLYMNILLYCHYSHYHLALMELFAPFDNPMVDFIFFSVTLEKEVPFTGHRKALIFHT